MEQNRVSWDQYFIEEAARVATRSKDPARKVGAIIVRPDNTEAARGYNGFPKGVEDRPERYLDKDFKSAVIMHAEENAIRNARGEDLSGYTLYVTPYMPCAHCASWIATQGITRVVTDMARVPEKWRKSFEFSEIVFRESGVDLVICLGEQISAGRSFQMISMNGDVVITCRGNADQTTFTIVAVENKRSYDFLPIALPCSAWLDRGRLIAYPNRNLEPSDLGQFFYIS